MLVQFNSIFYRQKKEQMAFVLVNQSSLLDLNHFFLTLFSIIFSYSSWLGQTCIYCFNTKKIPYTPRKHGGEFFFSCNLNDKNNRLVWLIIIAWIHKKKVDNNIASGWSNKFLLKSIRVILNRIHNDVISLNLIPNKHYFSQDS